MVTENFPVVYDKNTNRDIALYVGPPELTPYERAMLDSGHEFLRLLAGLADEVYLLRRDTENCFGLLSERSDDVLEEIKGMRKELKQSIQVLPQKIADAIAESLKSFLDKYLGKYPEFRELEASGGA